MFALNNACLHCCTMSAMFAGIVFDSIMNCFLVPCYIPLRSEILTTLWYLPPSWTCSIMAIFARELNFLVSWFVMISKPSLKSKFFSTYSSQMFYDSPCDELLFGVHQGVPLKFPYDCNLCKSIWLMVCPSVLSKTPFVANSWFHCWQRYFAPWSCIVILVLAIC